MTANVAVEKPIVKLELSKFGDTADGRAVVYPTGILGLSTPVFIREYVKGGIDRQYGEVVMSFKCGDKVFVECDHNQREKEVVIGKTIREASLSADPRLVPVRKAEVVLR